MIFIKNTFFFHFLATYFHKHLSEWKDPGFFGLLIVETWFFGQSDSYTTYGSKSGSRVELQRIAITAKVKQ